VPSITTTAISVSQRGNKLYVDPKQNDQADTVASTYSCRPYKVPTVSTPLEWKEIQQSLNPESFTIKTILKRLEKKGDLFKGVHDSKIKKQNTPMLKSYLA
jgi:bifunctional non-homologous end joining protein LigD